MRKIVIHCTTNQAGTDSWEFYEVPESTTNEEIENLAWDVALSNAEMYGIYPESDKPDEYDGDEEVYDDNIEGYWQDYDPKLHDGHTVTGIPSWN